MKLMVIEIKPYQLNDTSMKLKPYLKDINNLKKYELWKIQLTIAINFISSKDTDKVRVIRSKRDNIQFMIDDNATEVIEKLSESLLNRYQIGLERKEQQ